MSSGAEGRFKLVGEISMRRKDWLRALDGDEQTHIIMDKELNGRNVTTRVDNVPDLFQKAICSVQAQTT